MSLKSKRTCQVCINALSKYTCSKCATVYCSVPCYRTHIETCRPEKFVSESKLGDSDPQIVVEGIVQSEHSPDTDILEVQRLDKTTPLRPLTSLRWPYVPEESAYPDPLKRDDPKPLQLRQYEAIATSPAIRNALRSHPQLQGLLTSMDKLRGSERDLALQKALGVTATDIQVQARGHADLDGDVIALRELAEAVEVAVRGGREGVLGLDWKQ